MPHGTAHQRAFAKQDAIFAALERLEGKETQQTAFEELLRLIKDLEQATLSSLLHAAGTQTAKTTAFARVHSLRLAALCCTQQHCMQWRAMLEPPLLSKLLGLLSRALHDRESAVRGAAAEAFGVVAAQLAAAYPGVSSLTAGNEGNPLLACILDALGEPGGAVQAAAATALAEVADHLQPLKPMLLRQLLHNLNNNLFLGRADLWRAVARLDAGRVRGLVATSFQQLLAAMPEVLGSTAEGTGLLGALTSRVKDFKLRAAAAQTLKALAVGIGPFATGWDAACAALKMAKTDISKPVRDAALAAMPVVAGLQKFVAAGSSVEQWPAVCGSLLAAEAGGKRWSPGLKAKQPTGSRPMGPEELGGMQCIPAVYPAAAPALPAVQQSAPPAGYAAGMPGFAAVLAYGLPAGFVGAASAVPSYGMPPAGLPSTKPLVMPDNSGQLAVQLTAIQAQQASMAATLSAFTASTQTTLQQLQQHLVSVSAGVAALASSAAAPDARHAAQLQQDLAAANASMAALAVGVGGVQQMHQALAAAHGGGRGAAAAPIPPANGQPGQTEMCIVVPAPAVSAQAAQLTRGLAAAAAAGAGGSPVQAKRLSSLHRSYNALDQALHGQHPPKQQLAQQGASADGACHTSAGPSPAATSPGGVTAAGQMAASSGGADMRPAAPSWEATYGSLLPMPADQLAVNQPLRLKLLRCMAKSGPVWEHLSAGTAQRLVQAITFLLQEGTALKRLLPALWVLADTASPAGGQAAAALPLTLREQLLAALAAYPLQASQQPQQNGDAAPGGVSPPAVGGSEHQQLEEKRELLLSALRAVWG